MLERVTDAYYHFKTTSFLEKKYFEAVHSARVHDQEGANAGMIMNYILENDKYVLTAIDAAVKAIEDGHGI